MTETSGVEEVPGRPDAMEKSHPGTLYGRDEVSCRHRSVEWLRYSRT
jgi:hypothetical protein